MLSQPTSELGVAEQHGILSTLSSSAQPLEHLWLRSAAAASDAGTGTPQLVPTFLAPRLPNLHLTAPASVSVCVHTGSPGC